MRSGPASILALALLAGWSPVSARISREAFSRVENHSTQPWRVGVGRWVAGRIGIRPAGTRSPLVYLKGEGEAYALAPGKAIDLVVQPTGNGLALQLALARADGLGPGASAYVSQGLPGSSPTLNLNPASGVEMEKAGFGQAALGKPFILIR
jgi:hypothetical protein